MNIRELRKRLNETQSMFARRYNIPFRTVQNWENGVHKPPAYVSDLLEMRVNEDLINRKTYVLPKYSSKKKNLPAMGDYTSSTEWLRAVRECLGKEVVFALDEALMCQGSFWGRNDEFLVWVYGPDDLTGYNGVVILGNQINGNCIREKDGLRYTDFNRTVCDALANENILDMQGITEALSDYYYAHDESFEGIAIAPEYSGEFAKLAHDAIEYYDT